MADARNIYFELTREFNREARIAILASGQAVVFYRLAIMSKDGDWIVRESSAACTRVLDILAKRGARYRAGAPLDVRWLAGGWSSHFELFDAKGRRLRCDFFSRPPRLGPEDIEGLFSGSGADELAVVGLEALIRMKQTQRAKDYPVIGELAKLLQPERELELTTDPDRILELAARHGGGSRRPSVLAARGSGERLGVVLALAEENDQLQRMDRDRLAAFERASQPYQRRIVAMKRDQLALPAGHDRLVELAERWLPTSVDHTSDNEDGGSR